MLSKLMGLDAPRRTAQQALGQMDTAAQDELSGTGWQQAFNQTAGAELAGALPQLRNQLQLSREDAIRRGVSGGDLATSTEGDITSAWQKNIANSFAGQAANMYNQSRSRYLDLLSGKLGYASAQETSAKNFWGGLAGAGLQAGGMILGGY